MTKTFVICKTFMSNQLASALHIIQKQTKTVGQVKIWVKYKHCQLVSIKQTTMKSKFFLQMHDIVVVSKSCIIFFCHLKCFILVIEL